METDKSWSRWRGDVAFFAYCAIGMAIAYPFDRPWRAIAFALAAAAFIIVLVIWSRRRTLDHRSELDNMALFFYSYTALSFAVAQFFEPPITGIVIAVFGFVFLLVMLCKVKLQRTDGAHSMREAQ